ncbi:hypothetical protein CLOM_g2948 [Closterium sp. NIES-68]|nr:hypothetical protein CLOM_g2948 [Closterium sp. NIES-68]GJP73432.1 hypothetical protein CLOP_g4145 [Closterium sp. NIES-67]
MGKPEESSSAIPAESGAEPSSSAPRGNDGDAEIEEDEGWVYDSNDDEDDDMILIRGADISGRGAAANLPEGMEEVVRAAEEGDSDALRDAIQGLSVPLDSPGEDGNTALHLACLYGHTACVELLLAAGAALEARDEDGAIPFHDACAGGFSDVVGMLLATASDEEQRRRMIAAQDGDGDTPLHNAARGEHPSVCRLLLDAGANAAAPNYAAQVPWQLVEDDSELRTFLQAAATSTAQAL